MTRREFLRLMSLLAGLGIRPSALFSSEEGLEYEKIRALLSGRKLFIIPFSHGDWTWTYTRHWTLRRDAIIFSEVLDILKSTPEFRFFIESWNEQLEPFLELRPERVPELSQAIREGKVEVCGAVANQHPAWMEAESQIRDIVIGRRLFSRLAPGLNLEVMTHDDVTPGSSQMPQILSKGGYRYYRIHRPDQALTAEGVPRDFLWIGLDGSELLTSRGFACGFMRADSLPDDFATHWEDAVKNFYEHEVAHRLKTRGGSSTTLWLPFGCDDSRPLRAWRPAGAGRSWTEPLLPVPEFIREWDKRERAPMAFATPLEFFRELEKERATLPRHNGILDPTMWTYWYGLNGNDGLRLWRTRADQTLVSGESWWSCAASIGETYPEAEFERLWHDLLRTYSHAQMWLFSADYAAQLDRVKSTLSLGNDLRQRATQKIAGRVKVKGDSSRVLLFNDLPWERTEVINVWPELQGHDVRNILVRDAGGNVLPHQAIDVNWYEFTNPPSSFKEVNLLVLARVPAMGYTTLYFEPAPGWVELPKDTPHEDTLETEFATVGFSGRGVEFLLDKESGGRYSGLGNVIFNEADDVGPYHFGPVVKTLRWTDAKLKTVVRGRLRSSFTLEGALGPHDVQIIGHLYPHARRLAFEVRINSAGGSGHFMTTVGLPGPGRLAADVHFGVEDRDVTRIAYQGEERLRKNVFHADHWLDYSDGRGGLTMLGTTGEKGYQLFPEENVLGHFLLMTIPPSTDWERFVTGARAGIGRQQFEYQFLLHSGDWNKGNVVRRALEARHPVLPVFPDNPGLPPERTLPDEKSFLSLSPSTAQISAFYRDGNRYLVRLYESAGLEARLSLKFPFGVASAAEVDFHGKRLGKSITVAGNTVEFDIRPWEIVTVAIT